MKVRQSQHSKERLGKWSLWQQMNYLQAMMKLKKVITEKPFELKMTLAEKYNKEQKLSEVPT